MVYQIFYQESKGSSRHVLFDIEMYIKENDLTTSDNDRWYVEMHSDAFISGAVDFFVNTATENVKFAMSDFTSGDMVNLSEFADDCNELEELRGWLWETHSNRPRTMDAASKDKSDWMEYVKAKIYGFANKYGLYVNED